MMNRDAKLHLHLPKQDLATFKAITAFRGESMAKATRRLIRQFNARHLSSTDAIRR